jgi:hypothetical protein
MATITTYVTDAEIEEFFRGATEDPTWVVTNIPLLIRGDATVAGSSFDYITQCLNYIFCDPTLGPVTYLVNGEDHPTIFSPIAPITTLSEVTIIAADGTEETLTLTGANREVFWDHSTGKITLVRNGDRLIDIVSADVTCLGGQKIFPNGCENIRLVGEFGIDVPPLLKLAQLLVMLKQMQLSDPGGYGKIGNITEEKIGRYEYKLGAINSTGAWGGVKSMDYYIQDILSKVPQINTQGYEAI